MQPKHARRASRVAAGQQPLGQAGGAHHGILPQDPHVADPQLVEARTHEALAERLVHDRAAGEHHGRGREVEPAGEHGRQLGEGVGPAFHDRAAGLVLVGELEHEPRALRPQAPLGHRVEVVEELVGAGQPALDEQGQGQRAGLLACQERRRGVTVRGGVNEIADGIWRWTGRHPEWHPGAFGAEVASYALPRADGLVLIDPLVIDDAQRAALDELVAGPVTILITIPYHARSAAELAARWPDTSILGPKGTAKRFGPAVPFSPIAAGDSLPHGITAHAIGRPRRGELPLHLPWASALAFGDAVVGVDGGLRVWQQGSRDPRFHRERFVPMLEPLVELGAERVLVTHGPAVLSDGAAALRAALDAPPWP